MKQILLYILFLLFTTSILAGKPIKIGVITDTHYLSEKLTDDGYALQDYIQVSGKNIKDAPAVLDKVLDDYLHSDIEVLLVNGDMTKDGEKQSHLDFVNKLKPLQDKGVKVFVIPGNHDINMPNSV
jgi:3',5'-cyclic AMP phosphodiesterase CpdA